MSFIRRIKESFEPGESLRTGRKELRPAGPGAAVAIEERLTLEEVRLRLSSLTKLKKDLESALLAVSALQTEATAKQKEYEEVKARLLAAQADKSTLDLVLQLPHESLARVIANAGKANRLRGLLEGAALGLATGVLSSAAVWYLTK